MKKQFLLNYQDIIALDNLLSAWQEFLIGKKSKQDIQQFSLNLMDNIITLHGGLAKRGYKHGGYQNFYITDPKLRHIHKASVRDRLLHHAIYRQLYPFFSKTFIADSFSCQLGKGTHRAMGRFKSMAYKVSKNNTKTAWVLQCDIKEFFDSIDQETLVSILKTYISDKDIICLLKEIITSYETNPGKGLPLGYLTSQLFVNIYLNEFDHFVKHKLKAKHYLRYADDFVLLSTDKKWLLEKLPLIKGFLDKQLKLTPHPQKVFIKTLLSGLDFLGWVHFSHHRVLRTKSKKRMLKRIRISSKPATLASYLGLLKHGNAFKLQPHIINNFWLWEGDGE